MASKIGSSVKGLVKEPLELVKGAVKGAKKTADTSNVSLIAIGAAVSPLFAYGYNKGFNLLFSKFDAANKINPTFRLLLKIFLPLVPMYFVKRFNVPFGSLINGGLAGIAAYTAVSYIIEKISGKSWKDLFAPSGQNPQIEGAHSLFAEWQ